MIKNQLQFKIKNTLDEIAKKTSLIWGGIVGSFIQKEIIPKDIDILLIYEVLTKREYEFTINHFKKLAKEISNGKRFIIEERNGPFKPIKKKVTQFHLIIQSRKFFKYTAQTATLSYIEWTINNLPLYGSPILSIFEDKRPITKEILLNTKYGGIGSSIKSLKNKKIYYAVYRIKNNKIRLCIESKQPANKEIKNSLIGIIKANLMNFVKWKTHNYSPSYNDIIKISKTEFPKYSKEIDRIYSKEKTTKRQVEKILKFIKEKVESSI